jgi:hypothetical protein
MRGVRIEKPADHALILRVMLLSLALEEFDAALAQRDRDFEPFFPKGEVLRTYGYVSGDL